METAGKQPEEAQKSGDPRRLGEALGAVLGAALGSAGKVESLAPDRLKGFPVRNAGRAAAQDARPSANAALASGRSARAGQLRGRQGRELSLEITDLGSAQV